jgi:hypothetical protein
MESIVNKEPVYLFSTEQIPYTSCREIGTVQWFGHDSEQRYRKNPHPVFGTEDIIYQFNSHGYRCPEFSLRDRGSNRAINVVYLGASVTLGTGLAEDKTYPSIFARILQNYLGIPVINWNLGVGGASADLMSRTLLSALPVLKPDLVILTFPPTMARREYISEDGRYFACQPRNLTNNLLTNIADPELANVYKSHRKLLSSYNDLLNFYKNYQVCESLCDRAEIMWLFAGCKLSLFDEIKHLICAEKLLDRSPYPLAEKYRENPEIGLARDMLHPGIQPTQELAGAFFVRFKELYLPQLEQLKYKINGISC